MTGVSTVERQKGLTTGHLHKQLDPLAYKLTNNVLAKYVCLCVCERMEMEGLGVGDRGSR